MILEIEREILGQDKVGNLFINTDNIVTFESNLDVTQVDLIGQELATRIFIIVNGTKHLMFSKKSSDVNFEEALEKALLQVGKITEAIKSGKTKE